MVDINLYNELMKGESSGSSNNNNPPKIIQIDANLFKELIKNIKKIEVAIDKLGEKEPNLGNSTLQNKNPSELTSSELLLELEKRTREKNINFKMKLASKQVIFNFVEDGKDKEAIIEKQK